MKKLLLLCCLAAGSFLAQAQQPADNAKDSSWKKVFRESSAKINNLVHTKLDVRFDYDKAWMYGKAWITLKPHFYATDSLRLDAKGMEIKEIALLKGIAKIKLKYEYDGMQLNIHLDKTYKSTETYTVYIDYIAKPNELEVKGSAAITDAKGLYFINPKGEEKDKPTQIWTQGETEATSVWAPTIDRTNQKCTNEIYMTVPAKYVTLSNGLLISQKKNADGTRTDYWKMDLPHSPYLFFMGVGEYAIIKESYKGKEVSYYVEKDQAPYAKGVFGRTPEMIKFFSNILGVDYPWSKYAQIVGRDYVSGAMENTTATLHQESAYQNSRELTDGNRWEGTIAHELFHQWFGDLVTAESWSHLTLNESFANYSEYLWLEYKEGKDAAYEHQLEDMNGYLQSGSDKKDLVRFKYMDKEDMFDAVSYNKGGRILNMLRNYVGDEAFFKSLNLYLTQNKFKSREAADLRLAFEEITGKDLNWFWNQWYYGSGHPKLDISYNYDAANQKAFVYVKQNQKTDKIFKLPVAIDIYVGKKVTRHLVWLENKSDTLSFTVSSKPDLINVDADKLLLAEKTDNKTADEYIFQYKNAPNYLDRKEALDYFNKKGMKEIALGLNDPYEGLRKLSIDRLTKSKFNKDEAIILQIEQIAATEKARKTKASAIRFLAGLNNQKYSDLFQKNVSDSSYSVAGAALKGLSNLQPEKSYSLAKKYADDARGELGDVVNTVLVEQGTEADFDFIAKRYNDAPLSQDKLEMTDTFAAFLIKMNDEVKIKKGIDYIISFRNKIPEQYRNFTDGTFKTAFANISKAKGQVIADYITSVFK